MNFQWKKWCVLPAVVLLAGTVALAQETGQQQSGQQQAQQDPQPKSEVGKRAENQQDRIANGFKSGRLTAGETAKLENQQRGINQQVKADRAANGGKLTAGEKQQINKEQNQASKNIYNKKHNAKTQPGTKKQ